jgi:tetratricopeptide (TPR) repeat protein
MHEERDALCRFVFPYLEDFCGKRNIGFTGIDLRWGVTEEEVQQGKTVALCLSEIDNCRPYFLGILGERYGWIPEKVLTADYKALFHGQRSITEAEMLYGALSEKDTQETKAFFCLRDKTLTQHIVGSIAEEPQNKRRLRNLKNNIRKTPYPVLDGYISIEEFSAFIKEQLCAAIEKDFPANETSNEYTIESDAHVYYATNQNNIFTGRDKELLDIDKNFQTNNNVFVTSVPGAGKTAFLAHWAIRRQASFPGHFVFMHFYGASVFSDRWENVAKRLIYELCRKFTIEFSLPNTQGELLIALSDYLHIASQKGMEIILVLDGIDLINTDKSVGLAWLPKDLPENVKMLLSVKTTEGRNNLLRRNYKEYRLEMLNAAEQKALLASHLVPYSKKLEEKHIARILQTKAAKNPLYLGVLLHELCTRSTHDRMDNLLDYYLQANNATELFVKVIEAYSKTYGKYVTRTTLSLIWGAKHGLTESELLSMLNVPPASFSPLYLVSKPYLVNKNGILNFAYTALREAVKQCYLSDKQTQKMIRRQLAEVFTTKQSFRAMEESAWLLEKTAAWTKLYDVLRNTEKFRQLWKNNPSEVKAYWEKIESNTKKRRITVYEQVTKQMRRIPENTMFSLATFFFETGYSNEAENLLLYLSTIRATQKNQDIQQYSFGLLGNLYYTAGRYREAKSYYKKKMLLCQKEGNTLELARVLGNLGVMENVVQNYEEALNYYEKAGTICRKLGFLHGIQTELGNRGNIYIKMKNLDKALEVFKKQEQICRESGLVPGLIATLSNLTAIMAAKKEFEKTLVLLDEQEMLCKKIGDLNQLQVAYGNRAVALYGLGKKQEALEWLNNKWSLCLKINNFDGQQMALSNLSVYYIDENDLDKALEYCCRRVDLCREHKARIPLAQSLYQYAHILGKYGRNDESESVLQQIEMLL